MTIQEVGWAFRDNYIFIVFTVQEYPLSYGNIFCTLEKEPYIYAIIFAS